MHPQTQTACKPLVQQFRARISRDYWLAPFATRVTSLRPSLRRSTYELLYSSPLHLALCPPLAPYRSESDSASASAAQQFLSLFLYADNGALIATFLFLSVALLTTLTRSLLRSCFATRAQSGIWHCGHGSPGLKDLPNNSRLCCAPFDAIAKRPVAVALALKLVHCKVPPFGRIDAVTCNNRVLPNGHL